MTAEQLAIDGERDIKKRADAFLEVTRRLNESRDVARDPYDAARVEIYRSLLNETCDRARDYFYSIEQLISSTELLGIQQSSFWASDLARTAANALDLALVHYPRIRSDYCDFLKETPPEPSPNAFFSMQSAVKLYCPERVAELKRQFDEAGLPTSGFVHTPKMNTRYTQIEKYVMWGTAIFFVLVMLAIGIFVKDYNDVNIFIFRTVLALAAGAFGSVFIPGLFQVEAKSKKATVSAAGAAAFFVTVFFFNPPALVKNSLPPSNKSSSAGDKKVVNHVKIEAGGIANFANDQFIDIQSKGTNKTSPVEIKSDDVTQTLASHFATDFSDYMQLGEMSLHIITRATTTPITNTIVSKVITSFESLTKFTASFFPASTNTIEAIEAFASLRDEVIKANTGGMLVKTSNPGDSASVLSEQLSLSASCYIYHEDDLSLESLGTLEKRFKDKGLIVQFRGPNYVTTKYLQKLAGRAK